ncbi:thiolase domain-containing protein [Papillibacter cinnamivorans]|uniref:Acetyl-CoA C-acetyltransferase n=1 Tax=Papillibacter cinnamivorans DSM 12816 TaxID=1122930 RepID=A0A1W2C483_9FIRM|nr:thiolase domain-containing protein [Papillibacter cinnamivorans]SMC79712.1 acetyl-CoA C-acetyltransferase [Papillibacter cinnamivorans DSM 12816]
MRMAAIAGIGETKMGRYPDRSLRDMILEAGGRAIADSGMDKKEIEAVYMGNFNSQRLCGQGHLGPLVSEVLGLGNIPTIRTEGACASGSLAFRMGLLAVMSGIYDTVLVGGAEKMTHQPTELVTEAIVSAMDYEIEAMEGFTFPANFAMMANRYFYEYRNVKREMAMNAVNAHYNAARNPDAQMPKEVTLEKVLFADLIASPLSLFDCSLVTDGAAFLVLTTSDKARALGKHRLVEVAGSGHAGDTVTLYTKKCITSFEAAKSAAKQAYDQAGLKPADIDLAEVHDCFTITQIINLEDLGFAEPGHGADLVAEGATALHGSRPINTSGGLKAKGHPIGATGISQMYEIVTQLRGDAGARQVKKADIGLTHNLGGTAATGLVHIFRGQ